MKIAIKLFLLLFLIGIFFSPYSFADTQNKSSFDIILIFDNSLQMKILDKKALFTFIDNIKEGNRLSIVSFSNNARLIYPFSSFSTDKEKKIAKDALTKLGFKNHFVNFKAGLELALIQFRNHGKKEASKIAILLTNAKPSFTRRQKDVFIKNILSEYLKENIAIYSIAYQNLKPQLLQEFAEKTNGKCFVAADTKTLQDSILTILKSIQPIITYSKGSFTPQITVNVKTPRIYIDSILILMIIAVLMMLYVIFKLNSPSRNKLTGTASFAKLHESVKNLSETNPVLKDFILDLEDYGAGEWQKEKDMQERYGRLVDGMIILLDHLELKIKEKQESGDIVWLYKKALRILEDENIEEIPVKNAEAFNGDYHKYNSGRPDKSAKGTILEIVRKGYYKKGKTKSEDIIFRPAEVIISSG